MTPEDIQVARVIVGSAMLTYAVASLWIEIMTQIVFARFAKDWEEYAAESNKRKPRFAVALALLNGSLWTLLL